MASRLDAVVATLVGILALAVSAYTAHIQKQQVRAFSPRLAGGGRLPYTEPGSEGDRFNQGRGRIGVEICYCSTLGDCWTLTDGGNREPTTTETARCPARSDKSFQQ